MKKNVKRINEAQLKRLIKEAVNKAMYDFASNEPQFDMNSDEYGKNYDSMRDAARGRDKAADDAMMDLQTKHHLGMKGKGDFKGELPKQKGPCGKEPGMSEETIVSEVLRALNNGESPKGVANLKPFSREEKEYIQDDCFDHLVPVGTIDQAGKIVFYDKRKNKFVSFEDDREY